MSVDRPNTLYRIYYGDMLMYVGRTHQKLARRLHGHFFGAPMHRKLDIFLTTKVEYAECETEADMYLYEIYYINRDKPPANRDDRARDELSVSLPELDWREGDMRLFGKWKEEIAARDATYKELTKAANAAFVKLSALSHEAHANAKGDLDDPIWDEYRKARDEWEKATKEAKVW